MSERILVFGGSGYLGGLAVCTALRESEAEILLPIRKLSRVDDILCELGGELEKEGVRFGAGEQQRLRFLQLPPREDWAAWARELRQSGVTEVLHCAGSVSYFNQRKLERGNIELTRDIVALAQRLDLRRFVFLSTAFCSGFKEGDIPEALHDAPGRDPNRYTETKRSAESIVAESDLPWVIVRPSIVVGDSRDGRYPGKPYGYYQVWAAAQRFWKGVFPEEIHLIGGESRINFLHQDAFSRGFWYARERLAPRSVVHLVSRHETLPKLSDVWADWWSANGGPRVTHLYKSLDMAPIDEIPKETRLWLEFSAVNLEIASSEWRFERRSMDRWCGEGAAFADVDRESLLRCQHYHVNHAPGMRAFVEAYQAHGAKTPTFIQH